MPDNNSSEISEDTTNIGNVENDATNTGNDNQDSSKANNKDNQANIQSGEPINSSNNESLPKTGVEDTGIILLIVTLLGVSIISFIKFIKIK